MKDKGNTKNTFEELDKFERLKERGVISEEEFEKKKKELLVYLFL